MVNTDITVNLKVCLESDSFDFDTTLNTMIVELYGLPLAKSIFQKIGNLSDSEQYFAKYGLYVAGTFCSQEIHDLHILKSNKTCKEQNYKN